MGVTQEAFVFYVEIDAFRSPCFRGVLCAYRRAACAPSTRVFMWIIVVVKHSPTRTFWEA